MANAKRASMREGPLAALFRKTEESEEPPAGLDGVDGHHARLHLGQDLRHVVQPGDRGRRLQVLADDGLPRAR